MSTDKTITVTRQQLIDTTRIMAGAVTSLMVGDHRIEAIERMAAEVFDGIAGVPFPTPTPLASTAMEAAREIFPSAAAYEKSDFDCAARISRTTAIIQKHFQPLLAKVEGEKDDAIKAHGFVWNAARKAAQYFRWAGCRDTIAIEAMNQCCEAEKLTPKWSTDWTIIPRLELAALRADLAAKEAAATKYRTALVKCHAHLCKEIQALSLNESAKSGSQSLLHEISVLLDSSALASRADKGGAR